MVDYLTDSSIHAPPTSGPHLFSPPGTWLPDQSGISFPALGQSYADPIFGSTIRRITDSDPSGGNRSYSINGRWNADGTVVLHEDLIDAATGAVLVSLSGLNNASKDNASFHPTDPDIFYYPASTNLRKIEAPSGDWASATDTVVKNFGSALGGIGGSVDWIDNTGRYMLLNVGGIHSATQLRIWDLQTDTLYSGSINVDLNLNDSDGWAGLSPDGNYVIAAYNKQFYSFAVNHGTQTLSTTAVLFWTVANGGHADVLTASDGKTYAIIGDGGDASVPGDPATGDYYRVDITIAQSSADTAKQRTDNQMVFNASFNYNDMHISCVSYGARRDWVFMSPEDGGGPSGWIAYQDEVIMVNVLTLEIRRYAHTRSREASAGAGLRYYEQPKVQAMWDGSKVLYSSNYGLTANEYGDLYVIEMQPEATKKVLLRR